MRPILAGVHLQRQPRIFTYSATVPEETTVTAVTIPLIHHASAHRSKVLETQRWTIVSFTEACRLELQRTAWIKEGTRILIHLETYSRPREKSLASGFYTQEILYSNCIMLLYTITTDRWLKQWTSKLYTALNKGKKLLKWTACIIFHNTPCISSNETVTYHLHQMKLILTFPLFIVALRVCHKYRLSWVECKQLTTVHSSFDHWP